MPCEVMNKDGKHVGEYQSDGTVLSAGNRREEDQCESLGNSSARPVRKSSTCFLNFFF